MLNTWQTVPKETLLKAFEAGNFAGVDEMKRNDRLFQRVAPMGVNDIMMAVQYTHVRRDPLNIPIFAIDGRRDRTIQRGYMREWRQYTTGRFRNIPIEGDHYFVSSSFQQASASATGNPLGMPRGILSACQGSCQD